MKTRLTQFLRDEWLQLLVIAVTLIAVLATMPYATERVPMQWNLQGQVNWYAPKTWGLLVLPATMVAVFVLTFIFELRDKNRRDPADGSLTSHGKAVRSIRFAIFLMLAGVCFIQIAASLGRHPDVGRLVPMAVGLLFAFMGNLFGKLKPNRYMGIRVPWTLNSETVWRKTHRAAGWLWTTSGLAVALLSMFAPTRSFPHFMVAWIVVLVGLPLIVAWHAVREERRMNASTR